MQTLMKTLVKSLIVLISAGYVSLVLAVPPGMKVEFTKSPMGVVTFVGKTHADKGQKCDACHPKLFQQKKGTAKITLMDHQAGKFCFTCHNGKVAFASKDNCNKCHVKK